MSKQRDMLPEVLAFVQGHIPDCPVYLAGSVSLRHERTDSDIDVVIIVPDVSKADVAGSEVEWEEDHFKLATVIFHDIPIHLHITTQQLLRDFENHPWRAYKFLKTEKLYDPEGVVQETKNRIASWFSNRPEAVKLWEQWLDEHKERQLSRGSRIGPLLQQLPNQMPDLWNHLDDVYGDKVVEPRSTGDG